MASKRYEFLIDGRDLVVEAEHDGNCRYMVRVIAQDTQLPGRIRIGYLTGRAREWLAERFGGESTPTASAKAACRVLAEWAIKQAGFPQKALVRPSRISEGHSHGQF